MICAAFESRIIAYELRRIRVAGLLLDYAGPPIESGAMNADDRLRLYWIGIILGTTSSLGILAIFLSLKGLGIPQPPHHLLPLVFLGDIYCSCLFWWMLRRLKKMSGKTSPPTLTSRTDR